jgi:hypothetical protein
MTTTMRTMSDYDADILTCGCTSASSSAPASASHIEFDIREGRWRIRRLLAELEKSLQADVPLHKRGFGVMDEDGA